MRLTENETIEAGEDFLEHYGVMGMHWGIRNDRESGVSRKTDRMARKDAKEFARAKMYYGEGAGTRRKLIKATVDSRSSKNPGYRQAFNRHLNSQDMSIHAQKASSQRSRTDKKKSVRQGAGFVARRITGEWGTTAAFTAVALGGAAYLRSPAGRQHMTTALNQLQTLADNTQRLVNARNINRFIS